MNMAGSPPICGVVNVVVPNMFIYQRITDWDIGTGFIRDGEIVEYDGYNRGGRH
jgi:hypothetical protein